VCWCARTELRGDPPHGLEQEALASARANIVACVRRLIIAAAWTRFINLLGLRHGDQGYGYSARGCGYAARRRRLGLAKEYRVTCAASTCTSGRPSGSSIAYHAAFLCAWTENQARAKRIAFKCGFVVKYPESICVGLGRNVQHLQPALRKIARSQVATSQRSRRKAAGNIGCCADCRRDRLHVCTRLNFLVGDRGQPTGQLIVLEPPRCEHSASGGPRC